MAPRALPSCCGQGRRSRSSRRQAAMAWWNFSGQQPAAQGGEGGGGGGGWMEQQRGGRRVGSRVSLPAPPCPAPPPAAASLSSQPLLRPPPPRRGSQPPTAPVLLELLPDRDRHQHHHLQGAGAAAEVTQAVTQVPQRLQRGCMGHELTAAAPSPAALKCSSSHVGLPALPPPLPPCSRPSLPPHPTARHAPTCRNSRPSGRMSVHVSITSTRRPGACGLGA
jgi:hypothetical protein